MIIAVLILVLTISIGFYIYIRINYSSLKKIKLKSGLSGFEVGRKILDGYDLNNVYITESKTQLTSRYDINRKVIRLTNKTFDDTSLVSCVVSAMEASHAIQDKKNDKKYQIREKLMPIVRIILIIGYIVTLYGCFFGHVKTITIGLSLIDIILLFHLFFYSVDKKARKISLVELVNNKIIVKNEQKTIKKLLNIASYTSFASIIFPIAELIKRIIEYGDSNR